MDLESNLCRLLIWDKYEVEITQKSPSEQEFIPQKGRWQSDRRCGRMVVRLVKFLSKVIQRI